ncbi:hypothetical protein ABPG77_010334 [Micractinium sp. CCAP 211/92]
MQAQAWSIPFPRKERAGKKKPAHKRSGRRPAAAPATAAGTRRPLPPWNSSTTDLDKHKLTAAELSFRKSLRQSRHRQHSWADHSQQQAEAAAAVEAGSEGQLARLAGVKVQLLETRAEVARLREQNEQLQTDLDDFVSHTSTLLTSLQTQLSGFLAAGASPTAGADAAAPQHAQQVIMPRPTAAAAAGAAVLQARAAAEALSISQQGHTPAACSSTTGQG